MLSIISPADLSGELSRSLKIKRKWLKHSREKAAELSGVPVPTIRRFEDSGEISLRQLLMLCQVYGELSVFKNVFTIPKARTIDELIKRKK
ncbi:MAG: helix-turn-helix transcriptional regulator [Alteromonadaceae bacterium]|nr:helix-turn-helix transcriptional regulator [Alteromonadaceae bacterium]